MTSDQNDNRRDGSLDGLRVLASIAVVWLHVSCIVVAHAPSQTSFIWWVGNATDAATRWCVPVFVMLSGALLLERDDASPRQFYKRRLARILIPTATWTLVYLLWSFRRHGLPSARTLILLLARGDAYYHLWYLYMTLVLYAVTPILTPLVRKANDTLLHWAVLALFAFASSERMANALFGGGPYLVTSMTVFFLGYYLLGYLIVRRGTLSRSVRFGHGALVYLVCTTCVAGATGLLLPRLGPRAWRLMYEYLNPLVILMAIAVFLAVRAGYDTVVRAHSVRRAVTYLSSLSLGIYLIHPLWLDIARQTPLAALLTTSAWGIPLLAAGVFVLSVVSAALLAKIPLVKATIGARD